MNILNNFKNNNKDNSIKKDDVSHHMETSQLIFFANSFTGFYMMGDVWCSGVVIVNLDHIQNLNVVFLFQNLNK